MTVFCCVSRDPVVKDRKSASCDFLKYAKCVKGSGTNANVCVFGAGMGAGVSFYNSGTIYPEIDLSSLRVQSYKTITPTSTPLQMPVTSPGFVTSASDRLAID